jgi:hypothetical protein
MEALSKKRTLDSFFAPVTKKARREEDAAGRDNDTGAGDSVVVSRLFMHMDRCLRFQQTSNNFSEHSTYPFPIPHLPISVSSSLSFLPSTVGKVMNDQPDLDVLYFQPYIPKYVERQLFEFLGGQLPFYRVEYKIKRGNIETQIRTPRYALSFLYHFSTKLNRCQIHDCLRHRRDLPL